MKKVLLVFVSILIFSCSQSPEAKLDKKLEAHIKATANDPSSYEAVETTMIDTFYVKDLVDIELSLNKDDIETANSNLQEIDNTIKGYETKISNEEYESIKIIYQEGIVDVQNQIKPEEVKIAEAENNLEKLNSIKNQDEIAFVRALHRCRLKNGMGGLTLQEYRVIADKDLNILNMTTEKDPYYKNEEVPYYKNIMDLFEENYLN